MRTPTPPTRRPGPKGDRDQKSDRDKQTKTDERSADSGNDQGGDQRGGNGQQRGQGGQQRGQGGQQQRGDQQLATSSRQQRGDSNAATSSAATMTTTTAMDVRAGGDAGSATAGVAGNERARVAAAPKPNCVTTTSSSR